MALNTLVCNHLMPSCHCTLKG